MSGVVFRSEALLVHVGLKMETSYKTPSADEEHVIWSKAQEQILNGTF